MAVEAGKEARSPLFVAPSQLSLAWGRVLPFHVFTGHSLDVNRHPNAETARDGLVVGQSL